MSGGEDATGPAPDRIKAKHDPPTAPPHDRSSEDEEFPPPDDQLVQRIVDQVEYYFSDENITRDPFLLKHVRRNKEGYVSLKLISGFKKVKHLAKNWKVVAYALGKSTKLELNEEGTKLRRVDPLPPYDQTTPSRTIIAIGIPLEKCSIEGVAEIFKKCGEISLIRIVRPGNTIQPDVKNLINKLPDMYGNICAVIEFERTESAHIALQKDFNLESFIKVIEFNSPPAVDKLKKNKNTARVFEMEMSSSCASGSEAEDIRYRLQRRCSSPQLSHNGPWQQRRWSRDSDSSGSYTRSRSNSGIYPFSEFVRKVSSDSCPESYSSSGSSRGSLSDARRQSSSSRDSDCYCCCHARRGSLGHDSEGYGSSRLRANSGASDKRRGSLEHFSPKEERMYQEGRFEQSKCQGFRDHDHERFRNRENIIRMPKGPDGGRGFLPSQKSCHTLIE